MKRIIIAGAMGFFAMGAFAQNTQTSGAAQEQNFHEMLSEDIVLNDRQVQQINALNLETTQQVANIKAKYQVNSDVYMNKYRLILEERDAKLKNILTLEQYAVYLNAISDDLAYSSSYEKGDLKIKKSKSGKITVDDTDGKIIVKNDRLIVKNSETGVKTKIKDDEISQKDGRGNSLEIENDEVEIENEETGYEEEVEDDEAELETRDKKIKIKN